MKSRYLIAAYALICFFLVGPWAAPPASAQFLTESANFINVGDSVTLSVLIINNGAHGPIALVPGGVQLVANDARFSSGDGQQILTGLNFLDGNITSVTFSYSNQGVFTPSVDASLLFEAVVCGVAFGEPDGVCRRVGADAGSGGSFFIDETFGPITVAAVPEPSTWAMMLLGFAGLGFAFRQSRRKVSFA